MASMARGWEKHPVARCFGVCGVVGGVCGKDEGEG